MKEDQKNLLEVDSWQVLFPEIAVEALPQTYGSNDRTGNGTARSGIEYRAAAASESTIVDCYEAVPLSSTTRQSSSKSLSSTSSYISSEDRKGSHYGDSGHAPKPQGSDATKIPELANTSLMDRPPIQVMERDGKCDTERIPPSVFESNGPSSPADWSAASTESLFSIHLQKPSVGRELSFTPHDESVKSADAKSDKIPLISPSDPQPLAETVGDERANEGKGVAEKRNVVYRAQKDKGKTCPVYEVVEKPSPAAAGEHCSRMSCDANDNETSTTSCTFPFPKCCKCCKISFPCCKKKHLCHRKICAWSSCFCCNCSWFCCHKCKWPRLSCTWPSCSCCRCSWACGLKRLCCCLSTTTLAPSEQNGAVKGDAKASTSKKCCSGCSSCFSCLSCSSCCRSWGSCGTWFSCSKCCAFLPCSSCHLRCC
ncbi:hypothetical protein Droror1_Dr00003463 [Drosera rotundifolia]